MALTHLKEMEHEMKLAEVELKRRKAEDEENIEKERKKSIIATPGRKSDTPKASGDKGITPKRTPHRFGI